MEVSQPVMGAVSKMYLTELFFNTHYMSTLLAWVDFSEWMA